MSPHLWLPERGLADPGWSARGRTAARVSSGSTSLPVSAPAVVYHSSWLYRRFSCYKKELIFLPPLLIKRHYNL